jgi:hypothetical protein
VKLDELFEDKWDDQKAKYKANATAKRHAASAARRAEEDKVSNDLVDRVKDLQSYKDLVDFIPLTTSGKYAKSGLLVFGPTTTKDDWEQRDYYWRINNPEGGYQKLNIANWTTSWTKERWPSGKPDHNDPLSGFDAAFKAILDDAKFEHKLRQRDED